MKKFFNRESELELLKELAERAQKSAQMTFMVGPKGIGKTSFLIKASAGRSMLYFFIAQKHETLLVEEFVQQIKEKLDVEL